MLVDEDYLAHYGVMGMKWGVRHDRPRSGNVRKFLSSSGKNLKRFGKTTSDVVNKAKNAYTKNREKTLQKKLAKDRYKATKQELKTLRSKDARKARQIALTTHNPAELAKYQHLLSDSELNDRIKRLETENRVRTLATKAQDRKWETFKKKADWAMNSPVGKKAIDIGGAWVSKKIGVTNPDKEDDTKDGAKDGAKDGSKKSKKSKNNTAQSTSYFTRSEDNSAWPHGFNYSRYTGPQTDSNAYKTAAGHYIRRRYSQVRGLPSGKK